MYKLVIQAQSLANRKETPFRKIKGYNPLETNKQPLVEQMSGRVHLYKNYRQQSSLHQNIKTSLAANQINIKTQVLFLSNLLRSQFQSLMVHLKERQSRIQFIDILLEQSHKNHTNLIIYCKTILASQQIFQIVLFNFHALPLYAKQAIFVSPISIAQNHHYIQLVNQNSSEEHNLVQQNIVYNQKWIQIPRCIDCLQRLQYELTGISTQLFHQLTKTNRINCGTCQTIHKITYESTACSLCASPEDNWICMVCSSVGCGRYKNGDAFKHFLSDGHIITMDLSTQRVWNYLSDCFSHRVIPLQQQEITLKFPDYNHQKNDVKYQESLESAFWEYCSVVSEELQRQRVFYQKQKIEQQQKFKKENIKAEKNLEDLNIQLQQRMQLLKKSQKKYKKNEKRLEQMKQKCQFDRQILNNYEKTIRQDSKQESIQQIQANSDKIQQKLKILQTMDLQIESILMKLTQS